MFLEVIIRVLLGQRFGNQFCPVMIYDIIYDIIVKKTDLYILVVTMVSYLI
jgi:hypothetical protein